MNDVSLHIELGSVRSLDSQLDFKLVANQKGDAHVVIYALDAGDSRKSGVCLYLDAGGYQKLKSVLEYADCTIRQMRSIPLIEPEKLRIASEGRDLGEISIPTVVFMLEREKITLQDYYWDTHSKAWVELDLCPALKGRF